MNLFFPWSSRVNGTEWIVRGGKKFLMNIFLYLYIDNMYLKSITIHKKMLTSVHTYAHAYTHSFKRRYTHANAYFLMFKCAYAFYEQPV